MNVIRADQVPVRMHAIREEPIVVSVNISTQNRETDEDLPVILVIQWLLKE